MRFSHSSCDSTRHRLCSRNSRTQASSSVCCSPHAHMPRIRSQLVSYRRLPVWTMRRCHLAGYFTNWPLCPNLFNTWMGLAIARLRLRCSLLSADTTIISYYRHQSTQNPGRLPKSRLCCLQCMLGYPGHTENQWHQSQDQHNPHYPRD